MSNPQPATLALTLAFVAIGWHIGELFWTPGGEIPALYHKQHRALPGAFRAVVGMAGDAADSADGAQQTAARAETIAADVLDDPRPVELRCAIIKIAEKACGGRRTDTGQLVTRCLPMRTRWLGFHGFDRCDCGSPGPECTRPGPVP